ncbi:MAG: DNA polymerase III subunit alpha [Gemmatimonadota bacterium]
MSFVHLHTHSEYSLLDGANRIDDLLERTEALGMPALALTDHGNLHGAWEFQEKARARGIRPILGFEAYVAYGDRRSKERPDGAPADYAHLILLAADTTGYRNLIRLSSRGYTEGFYRRPRIDHEILAEHADGLIVLSACLVGEIAKNLELGRWERAREAAEFYARTFPGRYWLEVQNHGIPGQAEINEGIFRLADELGLGVVLTNDAHYLRREDADAHDTLLCIGMGKDKSDPDRLRFHGEESYFKSAEEMAALFPDRPDVAENTLRIAEECDVRFEQKYFLPNFPLPDDFQEDTQLLRHLAREGAAERYGDPLPPEVEARLSYELGVIEQTGYAGYFLIVWDFIRAARELDIPVGPGRGSSAGSIVAYCLRITDVDPLRFGLLFERFLNPERVSMPDIDIDFCYERRGRIIEYVREKYGQDSVGQIITFGTMKARAVVRDVGRVLGFSPGETDRLAKLIPSSPNYALTVAEAKDRVKELHEEVESKPEVRQLIEYATSIEGLSRHSSVHAAGVVIAPGPLDDYVPVCRDPKNGAESVITQFDMTALEKAGMLKMDFLGLRTLTVIRDAMDMVEARHGVRVDWDEIGLDDPEVYRMLASGGTAGVFQFESSLATEKLRAMRCDRFDDLIAVNALIRPGPLDSGMTDVFIRRKRGFEPVSYPVPELEEALEPTYGVITYQEQVMRVANLLAGFSLAEADVVRKAVGKKDAALTQRMLRDFRKRAVERGLSKPKAAEISDLIQTFGRYGFPKAHAVAYAIISYRTAWLKAHFPAEFVAALLSSIIDNTDKVVSYIAMGRGLRLEILPPSVSESGFKFTVVDGGRIRFGLGAIKGVGGSAIRSIIEAREREPFGSLLDFCQRIDLRLNNKRVLECLIAAGALDEFGERAALRAALEGILSEAQLRQRERESGQASLFAGPETAERPEPPLPDVEPWPESRRLAEEKGVLGFYISGHPLERHRDLVELFALEANTASLASLQDRKIELACVVTAADVRVSRKTGKEWCRLTVEDFHGTASALVFGDVWTSYRDLLAQDMPVLLQGTVSGNSRDEEDPPMFVDSVCPLSELQASGRIGICIELREGDELKPGEFESVRRVVETSPGDAPLWVRWKERNGNGNAPPLMASRSLRVAPTADVLAELRALLGRERVHLIRGRA